MVVDGENIVGVTRDRDEAESVTNKSPNVDDCKSGIGSAGKASESIDKRSIRCQDNLALGRGVIPNTCLASTHHDIADKRNIPIREGDYCAC